MRIVIFTDSLGRPRPDIEESEKTVYEDVYGYKLKEYFKGTHDVELLYVESLDTEDAIHWSQRMVAFRKPDLVIFHLGINDCAPRLFKKNSKSIVLNDWFRKLTFDFFLKLMSYFRYTVTKFRRITYVNQMNFKKNFQIMMREIKKYNPSVEFIAIGITYSDVLDKKSYGYNDNVSIYNKILAQIFHNNFIDINTIIGTNGLISDHIHLNKVSHQRLFEFLKNKIEDYKI